jgi:hypothetical protein
MFSSEESTSFSGLYLAISSASLMSLAAGTSSFFIPKSSSILPWTSSSVLIETKSTLSLSSFASFLWVSKVIVVLPCLLREEHQHVRPDLPSKHLLRCFVVEVDYQGQRLSFHELCDPILRQCGRQRRRAVVELEYLFPLIDVGGKMNILLIDVKDKQADLLENDDGFGFVDVLILDECLI